MWDQPKPRQNLQERTAKVTAVDTVAGNSVVEATGTDTLKCVICSPMRMVSTLDRSSVSIVERGLKMRVMHVHTLVEVLVSVRICGKLSPA